MEKPRQDRAGALLCCPQWYLNIRPAEAGRSLGSLAGDQTQFEFEGRFAGTYMDLAQLRAEPNLDIFEAFCYLSLC